MSNAWIVQSAIKEIQWNGKLNCSHPLHAESHFVSIPVPTPDQMYFAGNSTEQQSGDQSKDDVEKFVIDIFNNKKTKDKNFLLRVESDLVNFAKDHRWVSSI